MGGIGERVGNMNLGTFMAGFVLKMEGVIPGLNLEKLTDVVRTVYHYAGLPIPENLPYVGRGAFSHKGGVHIAAVRRAARLYEHVEPEVVGNRRVLLLNSLGGRAGVMQAAENLGLTLDKNDPDVISASNAALDKVRDMEMKGYRMGGMLAEQYLVIKRHFGGLREFFTVREPRFITEMTADGRELSTFSAIFEVNGNRIRDGIEVEGGPVDAAFKLYKRVLGGLYKSVSSLHLEDFDVRIADNREEASTVRTEIIFHNSGEQFSTVGVDPDLLMSALEAIGKGFSYYLNNTESRQLDTGKDYHP